MPLVGIEFRMTGQAAAVLAVVVIGFLIGLVPDAATAQDPTPTPSSSCCFEHEGSGCDAPACQGCVCEIDPDCCDNPDVGWDVICVAIVGDACAASCPCGPGPSPTPTPGGDCCGPHDGPGCDEPTCQSCVCDLDELCCSRSWDATCVSEALSECAVPCSCDMPGDCCSAHSGIGCDESSCQACVCDVDSACCELGWDQTCVDVSSTECFGACLCQASGPCCDTHQSPGCEIRDCQECVCTTDPDCCSVEVGWDEICVAAAADEECMGICGCEPPADCCTPHGGVGCDESVCESCVCSFDIACCDPELGWDASCVSVGETECLAVCGCPTEGSCCEEHPGVGCDQGRCIPCVCQLDPGCCTDAWDATCAAEAASECAPSCNCPLVTNCCLAHDGGGCEDSKCEACVCAGDSFCCEGEIWDPTCTAIAEAECADDCSCDACVGDCDGDDFVSIVELVVGVNIAIGRVSVFECPPADLNGDGEVTIDEMLESVQDALLGCF